MLAHEQDRAFAVGLEERDLGAVLVNGGVGLRAGDGDASKIARARVEFQNTRQVEVSVHCANIIPRRQPDATIRNVRFSTIASVARMG